MSARLSQFIVYVSDMQQSVSFYRDALGLPLRSQSEHWSESDTGPVGLALHLTRTTGQAPAGGSTEAAGRAELSLQVPDLDGACQALRVRGLEVSGPRRLQGIDMQVATLRDPDGLSVLLWQRAAE
jgi:lactoylglutathione lyase